LGSAFALCSVLARARATGRHPLAGRQPILLEHGPRLVPRSVGVDLVVAVVACPEEADGDELLDALVVR
jgi:hypothetical protein